MDEKLTDQQVTSESNKFGLFTTIPELVSRYGKTNILFSVIILLLIVNLVSNPISFSSIIERWNDKQVIIHKQGIIKRQMADLAIPSILKDILHKVDADRVMLMEFHNSGNNVAGLPFYHFTATYEEIREGVPNLDYVGEQYHNQSTGDYVLLINKMINEGSYFFSDIDNPSNLQSKALKRMRANGTMCGGFYPVYAPEGNICGAIIISSLTANGLSDIQCSSVMSIYSLRFLTILDGVSKKDGKL